MKLQQRILLFSLFLALCCGACATTPPVAQLPTLEGSTAPVVQPLTQAPDPSRTSTPTAHGLTALTTTPSTEFATLESAALTATAVPADQHEVITAFAFPAPHTVWMVAEYRERQPPETVVLRTANDGEHWTTVYTGEIHSDDVALVDADHAWFAKGATLFGTSDGGAHWAEIHTFEQPIADVSFPSSTRGWITIRIPPYPAPYPARYPDVPSYMTFSTIDGGATWQPAPDNMNIRPTFIDAQHGWGFGSDKEDDYTLVQTTDAGESWQKLQPPCQIKYHGPGPRSFLDATHAWLMCYEEIQVEVAKPLFHTSDGGKTWEQVALFDTCTAEVNLPDCKGEAEDITFLDQQHGWAMTGGSKTQPKDDPRAYLTISTTDDGGHTWHPISSFVGSTGSFTFLSRTEGYALIEDRPMFGMWATSLMHTSDGGVSWTTVYSSTR